MFKILFFLTGVPMIIMSFFEAVDVLPFVSNLEIIVDGNVLQISEETKQNLMEQVKTMFDGSRTMPAFGVVTDELFHEDIKTGTFVSLKFDSVFDVNELPFDELVFKVEEESCGFNLMRGMSGVFQGRCIYIDLCGKNMKEISDYIDEVTKDSNNIQNNTEETVESVDEN